MITKNEIIKNKIPYKKTKKIIGIYFLIYKEEIVYIGASLDILNRINVHKNSKRTKKIFDSFYFIETEINDLDDLEYRYIKKLKPVYNKKKNSSYSQYLQKTFERNCKYRNIKKL